MPFDTSLEGNKKLITSLKKNTNRIFNILGIVALLTLVVSGMSMLFGPQGESKEEMPGFLGLGKEPWLEIHESATAAFIAIVLVHIILHWRPVLSLCKQCIRLPKRLISEPLALIIVLLVVLLTAGAIPDETETEQDDDRESEYSVSVSTATYIHVTAGATMAIVLSRHVSRRWRRLIRAN